MATYFISNRGNSAIQEECWTLTLAEAQAVCTSGLLPMGTGSYWDTNFGKPTRRAKRAKAATVRLYTAGFSTGELSNVLFNCDILATERSQY